MTLQLSTQNGRWHCEPATWSISPGDGQIEVHAELGSDFWRITHYGFTRDNGHFLGMTVDGDFAAEVVVHGQWRDLYDQAGLMVRVDERHWIKCGIEYVHGVQQVSAVVTNEFSDWAVSPLPQNPPHIALRLVRIKEAVEIFYRLPDAPEGSWTLLRIAYLRPSADCQIGVMCAAPDGAGFPVRFTGFLVTRL